MQGLLLVQLLGPVLKGGACCCGSQAANVLLLFGL